MAKIVLTQSKLIEFVETDPITILDHKFDRYTNELVFTYRVKFNVINVDILKQKVTLRFADESPYRIKPNMFKNMTLRTTNSTLESIKTYSKKRREEIVKKKTAIADVTVDYHNIQKGYIDFDVQIVNPNQQIFAYFLSSDNAADQILASYTFDNSDVAKKYELPYDDFFFDTQRIGESKRRIQISSNDKRIKQFTITARNHMGANQDQFDYVSNTTLIDVDSNNRAFVDFVDTGSVKKSYRVSPVSFLTKTQLAQFKEVIVNNDTQPNTQCLIYPTSLSPSSVNITVASLPNGVISVDLLRSNVTQRDLSYTRVYTQRRPGPSGFSFTDPEIVPYNSYDYKVILEFQDGSRRVGSANCLVSPVLLDDIVTFESQLLLTSVVNGETTCNFNTIVTYKTPSNTSSVLSDLKRLGIDNIFPNEIKNLSTQLDPIIGVLVTRSSLSTGAAERVGIYKPGQITITSQDDTDHVYTLEVCLRSPAEVIEEIGVSSDFVGATGQFNPRSQLIASKVLGADPSKYKSNFTQKFFNRSSLTKGQLSYGKTLATSNAGIEAGRTGILRSHIVRNAKVVPKISPSSITSRPDGLIVNWTAQNLDDTIGFELFDGTGKTVKCNVNKRVFAYCATFKTSSTHVTLRTYTNYGDIITTEFNEKNNVGI